MREDVIGKLKWTLGVESTVVEWFHTRLEQ